MNHWDLGTQERMSILAVSCRPRLPYCVVPGAAEACLVQQFSCREEIVLHVEVAHMVSFRHKYAWILGYDPLGTCARGIG